MIENGLPKKEVNLKSTGFLALWINLGGAQTSERKSEDFGALALVCFFPEALLKSLLSMISVIFACFWFHSRKPKV